MGSDPKADPWPCGWTRPSWPDSFPTKQTNTMIGNLIEPAIKALIDTRNFTALQKVFQEWEPAEVAECIVDFPPEEQAIVLRLLPQEKAAGVLEYLDHAAQCIVLKAM